MSKPMGAIAIMRANRRLSVDVSVSQKIVVWLGRLISGIAQGVGLLALIQLASGWTSGQTAGGLGVTGWLWVLAITAVIGAVSIYFRDKYSYESAFAVMRTVHRLVGDQIAKLPLGWFSTSVTGRLSRLGAATVNELGNLSAHMSTVISVSIVTLLTLLVGLLCWYPSLGLLFAICLVCYAILIWALTYLDAAANAYAAPVAVELADRIVEFASCQPALRSANRASYPQLTEAVADNRRRSLYSLLAEGIGNFVGGIGSQIICVLMIFASVQQAFAGQLSPLEVVAVIGISLQMVQYLSAISECRSGILIIGPTMATILEVLDAKPLAEPEVSTTQPNPQQVELRDVSFCYQDSKQVLDGVSFVVPPRTMTAIIGPSGAGKTTIARLICRFWDVDLGTVLVGGSDVRDLTSEDLMSQISMVFQDVYLFDDTLKANIHIGDPRATDEQLYHAAKLAGVSEIVCRLPDGWDTRVGEGGTALSGGERQRVSIARAILKRAPIVLFDEATSALDAENEANLIQAFDVLRTQSTMIVIAHKLNTIAEANQIVVLDDHGRVAQIGPHSELINQPGIYHDFWENRKHAAGWKIAKVSDGLSRQN
ncbi:MAG: ABC transporter ATP-binding protein [Arcanobacterium sp.]|nr:ABC transporter ATP-binding protein [Arcanobacterium sp.]